MSIFSFMLIGYVFSLGVGHAVIRPIIKNIFKREQLTFQENTLWLAGWVGVLERFIYTTAVIIQGKEIIAGWLALKAIVEFKSPGRELSGYYAFLLGNGLSLAFGIAGGLLATHFTNF